MNVLIAIDKFKGSMTAEEAAESIASAWMEPLPTFDSCPIADGGEGTAEILTAVLGGRLIECAAHDALGRAVSAEIGFVESKSLAVMEMAQASGLAMIPENERDPFRANTRGTGEMMMAAKEAGAQRLIVGIGGSATNDGGTGMAQALGFRFLDAGGGEIEDLPARLAALDAIERPSDQPWPDEVTVACDVVNPLLGDEGCTRIYGPQKGIATHEFDQHEERLGRLADVVTASLGMDCRDAEGAGAAGGLGFGLMVFCGAKMRSGFELVAELTGLEEKIARSDLVITGEGSLDAQSMSGKGPVGVARLAKKHGRPVAAIAGRVSGDFPDGVFDALIPLAETDAEVAESIRDGKARLAEVVGRSVGLLIALALK